MQQQKFAALCFNRFFPHVRYAHALEQLILHTFHKRRYPLDALCLIRVYLGSKLCLLLESVGLRIPDRHISDFSMFNVYSSSKNHPSTRFASSANIVCSDVDISGTKTVSHHIL
jgi:hypothetical protein